MSHSTSIGAAMSRRAWLRATVAGVPLLVFGAGAAQAAATFDVRRFGARGDGRNDDTRAFQDAIDAARGGIVTVPAGDYLIDPQRSVRLRSGTQLRMDRGARLRAKPNALPRAYVLLVQGVEDIVISGGQILGDRKEHLGTTGEWGHGIAIYGASNVKVRDVRISGCWGDGMSIGSTKAGKGGVMRPSTDIEIANVASLGNRRQGLSIGRSRRVYVHDCEFSDTGGTPPSAGIDVEPDAGDMAQNVRIERCIIRRNRGPGIQVWKRATSVAIRDCTIEDNRNAGILAVGASDVAIERNRIRGNGKQGLVIRDKTARVTVTGNTFARNAGGKPVLSFGANARMAPHIKIEDGVGPVRIAPDNRTD